MKTGSASACACGDHCFDATKAKWFQRVKAIGNPGYHHVVLQDVAQNLPCMVGRGLGAMTTAFIDCRAPECGWRHQTPCNGDMTEVDQLKQGHRDTGCAGPLHVHFGALQ